MVKTCTKIKVITQADPFLLENYCNLYMKDLDVKNVQFMFDVKTDEYLAIITYEVHEYLI